MGSRLSLDLDTFTSTFMFSTHVKFCDSRFYFQSYTFNRVHMICAFSFVKITRKKKHVIFNIVILEEFLKKNFAHVYILFMWHF